MNEEIENYADMFKKQEEHSKSCFKAKVLEKEIEKPKPETCYLGLKECTKGCSGVCRQTC